MIDTPGESELSRRKGGNVQNSEGAIIEKEEAEEKESSQAIEQNEQDRTTWQTIKYYFNRFRYYHFIVADTIDKYVSAACLWFINLYFKLFMGVGQEPPSILTEES